MTQEAQAGGLGGGAFDPYSDLRSDHRSPLRSLGRTPFR